MAKSPLIEDIYIGGKWWKVLERTLPLLGQGHMGETHVEKCEIHINAHQNLQQMQDTLLHEVLHAIFSYTGLAHELREDDVPKPSEETLIQRLTPALLTVMRENPDFTAFLQLEME